MISQTQIETGIRQIRPANALRPARIIPNYLPHAEGSALIEMGYTRVLCTASVEESVPSFLVGQGKGWVTAEYGMLPRSTHKRMRREASTGKQSGRTQEIQRLIGRALRSCVDLHALGERQIQIDCDVIQADGGTRTASITGAYVALSLAINHLQNKGLLKNNPLRFAIASVSMGVVEGKPLLDLNYAEDSACDSDINLVMNNEGNIIEIQGTAEGHTFSIDELNHLIETGYRGIQALFALQQEALGKESQ